MKRFFRACALIGILTLCLVCLYGCADTEGKAPGESAQSTAATTESATDNTSIITTAMSPARYSTRPPAEEYEMNFDLVDTSTYTKSSDSDGNTLLTSPDGSFTATLLTNDSGTVYAFKYTDTVGGVSFYYDGISGELYCISTEDHTGTTRWFISADGDLKGIFATTLYNGVERVMTVYSDKGKRVAAAYYEDAAGAPTAFLDEHLNEITAESYEKLIEPYITVVE